MTGADIIRQAKENASEWLETVENPTELLVGILAYKVVELKNRIEYLERRLDHASRAKDRVN